MRFTGYFPEIRHEGLATSLANLFLSCCQDDATGNRSQTCGTAKDGWFDARRHIEPEYPACTDRFRFSLTGEIVPESDADAAAGTMIEVLNLNHPELKRDRREIQERMDGLEGEELGFADFVDVEAETVESHAHMACQRLGVKIP